MTTTSPCASRPAYAWLPDALDDQHLAGGLLWASGDLVGLALFGVLFVQWVRSSMREAEREDRRLDLLEARDAAIASTRGRAEAGTRDRLRVLVYSDDVNTRQQVILALGRRPHPDLPEVTYVEVATEPVVIQNMDAGGIDLAILDGEAVPAGGMGIAKQLKDEIYRCPPVLVLDRPAPGRVAGDLVARRRRRAAPDRPDPARRDRGRAAARPDPGDRLTARSPSCPPGPRSSGRSSRGPT